MNQHDPRSARQVSIRDIGLRRLSRLTRWMIAGAVAASGLFAAVAANARPGTTHPSSTAAGSGAAGSNTSATGSGSSGAATTSTSASSSGNASSGAQGLQAPAQAPQSAAAPQVSSGGS